MRSEDGSGSGRSSRSPSVGGSMGHSREHYWHDESMMEAGPGGDGGYRELHPEKPKELGEVDSLNPYVEQQAAPSLKQKSCAGYFPILGWLPFYSVSKLQGDLISGLSTGAMIIPQALAYRYDAVNINFSSPPSLLPCFLLFSMALQFVGRAATNDGPLHGLLRAGGLRSPGSVRAAVHRARRHDGYAHSLLPHELLHGQGPGRPGPRGTTLDPHGGWAWHV